MSGRQEADNLKPHFWIFLQMTISQSKIGAIEKTVYQEETRLTIVLVPGSDLSLYR
jgi:hypothetical protein